MPGSNARALEKARSLAADALILDLEDAVAPEEKPAARERACGAVRAGGYGERELIIRINALATPWGEADLVAAAAAGVHGILVPKVESRADVVAATRCLGALGADRAMRVWAMIETPRAVLDALAIADAAQEDGARLEVLVMGTNDLAKDTRTRLAPGRAAMLPWLMSCLAAARANGLDILDGVFNGLDDEDGFRAECAQGRELGMDGKTLIHPRQVEPCNQLFAPTAEEVEWARTVIATFDDPANAAVGAIRIEGQMVERMHLGVARRILIGMEGGRDA